MIAHSFPEWLARIATLVAISLVIYYAFLRLGFSRTKAYLSASGLVLVVSAIVQFTLY